MPSKSNKMRIKTSKNYPTQGDMLKKISYEQEETKLKKAKAAKRKQNKPKVK